MNPEKVVCKCKNVTKADLLEAIRQGATTYKAVQKRTQAGTKCGKCEEDVKAFIKKHKKVDPV
jgi:bacterioferritin-associated ferredoxin